MLRKSCLLPQELTYYGLDIYKERALGKLLEALAAVDGIEWIRLHYAYPSKFPLDIIDVMAEIPKVCNYLDMPLQHASDPVLKAMRRQITVDDTRKLIDQIRNRLPEIAIRTTMLVGFPGETDDDFANLMKFVEEQKFERLGTFLYSHEEDTSAYDLEDDVPDEVKQNRYNELMALQSDISFEKNLARIGSVEKILIDRIEGDHFIGRTEFDSPEVDNEVLIAATDHYARVGDFRNVEIINAEAYDLFARPIV